MLVDIIDAKACHLAPYVAHGISFFVAALMGRPVFLLTFLTAVVCSSLKFLKACGTLGHLSSKFAALNAQFQWRISHAADCATARACFSAWNFHRYCLRKSSCGFQAL